MAIAFTTHQATGAGTTTLVVTITGAASGNILFAFSVCQGSSARTVSSISTTNVTWTKVAGTTTSTIGVEIWKGVVAGGTSGVSVTYSFSGAVTHTAANVAEFSGLSSTVDGAAVTKTGSGTAVTTAAYSTAFANDIILSCVGSASTTTPSVQPGGSWSALTFAPAASGVGVQANYLIPGLQGAQSATWTITSAAWVSVLGAVEVTFKTQALTSSMATMAGTMAKQAGLALSGSMATMAAAIAKKAEKVFSAS